MTTILSLSLVYFPKLYLKDLPMDRLEETFLTLFLYKKKMF